MKCNKTAYGTKISSPHYDRNIEPCQNNGNKQTSIKKHVKTNLYFQNSHSKGDHLAMNFLSKISQRNAFRTF